MDQCLTFWLGYQGDTVLGQARDDLGPTKTRNVAYMYSRRQQPIQAVQSPYHAGRRTKTGCANVWDLTGAAPGRARLMPHTAPRFSGGT